MNLYSEAANNYLPNRIKVLFIAESPPASKNGEVPRYFYFDTLTSRDSLFREIMKVLYPATYAVEIQSGFKTLLLKKFQEDGYFLIDAVDYPINKTLHRDSLIRKEMPKLINRVNFLINNDTPIVVIKKNVYYLLSDTLKSQGFNVLNKEYINFPSNGNQIKFRNKLKALLSKI